MNPSDEEEISQQNAVRVTTAESLPFYGESSRKRARRGWAAAD